MRAWISRVACVAWTMGCGGLVASQGDGGAPGASAEGDAPHVGVELPAACPALAPCGGALSGTTWDYRAACIDNALDKLKGGCAAAEIRSPAGSVEGWVKFSGDTVLRTLKTSVRATIVLPPSCTSGASCSAVQAGLPPGSTCTGTTTCSCTVTNEQSVSDSDTYSVQGNTVVVGGGSRYDFCVAGGTLRYSDVGAHPELHGSFELARR